VGGVATGNFADEKVGTAKAVTVTGNNLSGTDADNYQLRQQAGLTADISLDNLPNIGNVVTQTAPIANPAPGALAAQFAPAPTPTLGQAPGTLTLNVGGFQLVEISTAQLAMVQALPTADTSTDAGPKKDSKSPDDAAVRQLLRTNPDSGGRMSLFVIDGGVRLPQEAQEARGDTGNPNDPQFQRDQKRK
jgi:hypothetical protein